MSRPKRTDPHRRSARKSRTTKARLDALVGEATVDAYSEAEQITGLFTMIEEHLRLPFEAEVLGVNVIVERVELNESDEIVLVCRAGRRLQRVPILDLPLPKPAPAGTERIAAYRHWLGG